jgi:subtilisin family serine protease
MRNSINCIIDFIKPNKNKDKKTDSKITKFVTSKDHKTYAKNNGFDYQDGDTRIIINSNELTDEILNKINIIATIEVVKNNQLQISIPVDDISKLELISEIKNIKSTLPPIQNRDIIVDGKVIEDSVFSKKYTSETPVSVAIIDLAFDENNEKITGNVIENISFRHIFENSNPEQIENFEYLHGTAMAQIITSMLPDVKLHLLSAGTELEFIDAMDYAISKEVDIITISYTWINYDTDGTSAITKKVEDAIKSEITVVIPSGNYAENYWEGTFNDTDGDKWHEFENLDEGMTISVDEKRIEEERPILVYLKWKCTTGFTVDFDLTLMNSENEIVDFSSSKQDNCSDEQIEYLYHYPEVPGEYYMGISNFGFKHGYADLEIISVYDKLEYTQSQGSVGVPTDARGAVVAGSLGIDGEVQPYSSSGPTNNGQKVPNIFTNDGFRTDVYDWEPFHGTSASAAYVSGLIAILYSEVDNVNPMTVTDLLYDNLFASHPIEGPDIQITGNAGKISKQSVASDWYLSLNEESAGRFPIQFTSNDKNNYKLISCENDMVIIQNTVTKDLMCVTKDTAESMIKRNWIVKN